MITMTQSKQINMNRNSSKGNQLKWFDAGNWYKADYLGYEGLAEYLISHLLEKSTVIPRVSYELDEISYQDTIYKGCRCTDFLQEGQEVLTLEKLFRLEWGIDLTNVLAPMELKKRILFVVEHVSRLAGLENFGAYLTMLLEIDAFFLNEDRHMNNIAVLRNLNRTFSYCPVFDNGAALFSDTCISYDLELPLETCYERIEAKPFNRSFDEQMDVAEELYGVHFYYWFMEKDVERLLSGAKEAYGAEIVNRVLDVMRQQMRKYAYFNPIREVPRFLKRG